MLGLVGVVEFDAFGVERIGTAVAERLVTLLLKIIILAGQALLSKIRTKIRT